MSRGFFEFMGKSIFAHSLVSEAEILAAINRFYKN